MTRQPEFRPMLAVDYAPERTAFPVLTQPKLDGVRCIAMWHNSRLVMLSRSGKKLKIPHIATALKTWLPKNLIADGELYLHGAGFQKITSMVKRADKLLEFHVFDMIKKLEKRTPFRSRLALMNTAATDGQIVMVPTQIAHNSGEINNAHDLAVENGYEGLIVRAPDAWYQPGRCAGLQKIKTFRDDEFEICGYKFAGGRDDGMIIFECYATNGERFSVVPAWSGADRIMDDETAESMMGEWIKVKYFELSTNGIPRFPVGLGCRADFDL